ncbi:MAG TPA: TlpA disulfide reductase family protein [Mucilaginibacter sp.]|nr:TlpA disulfide reductase family protein [Mucilaginibacter sp.]
MNLKSVFDFIKKQIRFKFIFNAIFFVFIMVLLAFPSAKALFIRGLMMVGMFQPEIPSDTVRLAVSPAFSFIDKSGKTVTLADLSGKVVFINFWATWCPPCLAELPSVNDLYKHFQNDPRVVFLIVDTDNDFKTSLPFIARHQYNLPVYISGSANPPQLIGSSIPTTVVINKRGQMVFRHEGTANYSGKNFEAYLTRLSEE